MKIYSITEIVQATNNLYKRANKTNIKNENISNIIKENKPLILSEPIEDFKKKTRRKKC